MATAQPTIFTIGVYGSTEESFFRALVEHEIELFIDIRARRGMRGARYSFANSKYLQTRLAQLDIAYAHLRELAPTKEIRLVQQAADKETRTAKRERVVLSESYIRAYRRDVLNVYKRKPETKFNADAILANAKQLAQLPADRTVKRFVLFCVEQQPEACHRLLVAEAMQSQLEANLRHLVL